MEWAEPLPINCPPQDAQSPNGNSYYRLIESLEPSEIDFLSHRMRWPDKKFSASECRARSLSIFDKIEECQKVRRFPTKRGKKMIEIKLPNESGLIKNTSNNHYSWWRSKVFNPIDFCTVLQA